MGARKSLLPTYKRATPVEKNVKLFSAVRTILFAAALVVLSITASATTNQFFSVIAPVELTASAPTAGTTTRGLAYTGYVYSGTLPNTDNYTVGVGVYPIQLAATDLQPAAEAFVSSISGKVLKTGTVTVDGQPAVMQTVELTSEGRTIRVAWLGTYKGSRLYQFVFATYVDVQSTDMVAVGTFFTSITLS
jgi:hypothetical protein